MNPTTTIPTTAPVTLAIGEAILADLPSIASPNTGTNERERLFGIVAGKIACVSTAASVEGMDQSRIGELTAALANAVCTAFLTGAHAREQRNRSIDGVPYAPFA